MPLDPLPAAEPRTGPGRLGLVASAMHREKARKASRTSFPLIIGDQPWGPRAKNPPTLLHPRPRPVYGPAALRRLFFLDPRSLQISTGRAPPRRLAQACTTIWHACSLCASSEITISTSCQRANWRERTTRGCYSFKKNKPRDQASDRLRLRWS